MLNIKFLKDPGCILFSIIFFLPIFIISGIAIAEVILFFLTIFVLINYKKHKDLDIFKQKEIIFLILFSIYIAINSIVQNENIEKYSSIFFIRHVLLAISIIIVFSKFYKNYKNLIKYLYFFFIIIILDSLFQFYFGQNIIGYKTINNRVSSFFGDELILGGFLISFFPIVLIFFHFEKNDNKNLNIFFFGFYFFIIFLSGERRSFLILIFSILFILIFVKDIRKLILGSLFIFLTLILLSSFMIKGTFNPLNRIFIKTYNEAFVVTKDSNLSKFNKSNSEFIIFNYEYSQHYKLALHLFKEKPFFGYGPKGFRDYCRGVKYNSKYGICTTHPHHILLQILAELGFLGLLFYVIAGIYVLYNFFILIKIKNRDKIPAILMTLSLFNIFMPFVPSGNFFNNQYAMINFYTIGIYLYYCKNLKITK